MSHLLARCMSEHIKGLQSLDWNIKHFQAKGFAHLRHDTDRDGIRFLPEQDVYCLFKTALPKGAVLVTVDAVTGDGHKVAAAGHAVDESREVPVVHVGSVELDDISDFLHEGLTRRFDAEHVKNVDQVIAGRPFVVNVGLAHDLRTK